MNKNKYNGNQEKKVGGKAKQNNRHAYGKGNGKFGKKTDRIKRANEREEKENVK
jgi:hypothetical protein